MGTIETLLQETLPDASLIELIRKEREMLGLTTPSNISWEINTSVGHGVLAAAPKQGPIQVNSLVLFEKHADESDGIILTQEQEMKDAVSISTFHNSLNTIISNLYIKEYFRGNWIIDLITNKKSPSEYQSIFENSQVKSNNFNYDIFEFFVLKFRSEMDQAIEQLLKKYKNQIRDKIWDRRVLHHEIDHLDFHQNTEEGKIGHELEEMLHRLNEKSIPNSHKIYRAIIDIEKIKLQSEARAMAYEQILSPNDKGLKSVRDKILSRLEGYVAGAVYDMQLVQRTMMKVFYDINPGVLQQMQEDFMMQPPEVIETDNYIQKKWIPETEPEVDESKVNYNVAGKTLKLLRQAQIELHKHAETMLDKYLSEFTERLRNTV